MSSKSPGPWYPGLEAAGIYLHIPFCKKACNYCNFHFSTSSSLKDTVVETMMQELVQRKGYLGKAAISSVYFGGGTPSLLHADTISRFFDCINEHYDPVNLRECTLEANPDDVNKAWLKGLRNTPINRLSIGIQSFRDEDLKYMGRAHTASQAEYAVKAAQDAGFTNITIDLIYGTPGLDNNAWRKNLEWVDVLGIPHLSAYALTVEERTALHYAIQHKKSAAPDQAVAADQQKILMEWAARAGFEHYEISNLARPGFYAVHNSCYWMGNPYLGIGPSAHSYNGTTRSWNIANNALYVAGINAGKPHFEEELLTDAQRFNEYVMTSLRTIWGLDTAYARQIKEGYFMDGLQKTSRKFLDNGWLTENEGILQLTNEGRLFADHIASEMFA